MRCKKRARRMGISDRLMMTQCTFRGSNPGHPD